METLTTEDLQLEQAHLFNIYCHSFFCKQSTGIPAPIQTDLQHPSTDVVTNHVACDSQLNGLWGNCKGIVVQRLGE